MKALRCKSIGTDLVNACKELSLETLKRPQLGDTEVRLRVHASCVNYFDLLMLVGKYQMRPELPFTVGSEASGTITEIGTSVSLHFSLRVGCFILLIGALSSEGERL